jgi:hypothetical protein
MNNLKNFFWFCSGANQNLLKRCPTESSKYVGIGATVLFTGILATISAGYALYTVFESFWSSFFFGLFWGGMIFNLDRFIVCSMKKRGNFRKEFKVASPRLLLAILLAMVISKPLELKIFEKEINTKIEQQKTELTTIGINGIKKIFPQIPVLEKQINDLKNEIIGKERNFYDLTNEANKEADGTGGSGHANKGPIYQVKAAAAQKAENDLEQTKSQNVTEIKQKERELQNFIKLRDKAIADYGHVITNYDGLAARIDALGALSSESSAMYLANLFLILLFIAIETSPIFVKLISSKGPYDDLLEKHEHSIENFKIEKMSILNQKTNERLEIVIQSGNNAVREELEGNRNLMKLIIDAETELAQEMISEWKENEMLKIKTGKHKKDNKLLQK